MDNELHIGDEQLQYIARISHGKDSLKMLDVIITRGLRLDRITTTDIWATDTIRGEHPEMVKFKDMADEYIWRKYRIEVEHLCAMRNGEKITYEKMFYHVPKRKASSSGGVLSAARDDLGIPDPVGALVPIRSQTERQRADRRVSLHKSGAGARNSKSTIYGFPVTINRTGQWCQKLKTRFLDSPAARGGKNIVEYIGIAADEPARFGQLNERKRAPLVEFGIEEDLCGLYCMYENILSPSYESSCRDGCWMCHNQGVNQLRQLRKGYPDLWALLLKWDKDSPVNFKPDGHTVHDYDERFRLEDEGFIPSDKRFFWRMLDEPLQKSLFVGEEADIWGV